MDPSELSKWDFGLLREKYEELGISYDEVFADIKDVIIKALISIEPHVCSKILKTHTLPHQCFDLFGFDILMDSFLVPWLLEVNMCPSLSSTSKLDKKIKTALLCDVFHVIGIRNYPHAEGYTGATKDGKRGEGLYNPLTEDMDEHSELSGDDLETLVSFSEEWSRTGENMERVFPLRSNWKYYAKFFECKRRCNFLVWRYLNSNHRVLDQFKA